MGKIRRTNFGLARHASVFVDVDVFRVDADIRQCILPATAQRLIRRDRIASEHLVVDLAIDALLQCAVLRDHRLKAGLQHVTQLRRQVLRDREQRVHDLPAFGTKRLILLTYHLVGRKLVGVLTKC